jgi:hypothetical protein
MRPHRPQRVRVSSPTASRCTSPGRSPSSTISQRSVATSTPHAHVIVTGCDLERSAIPPIPADREHADCPRLKEASGRRGWRTRPTIGLATRRPQGSETKPPVKRITDAPRADHWSSRPIRNPNPLRPPIARRRSSSRARQPPTDGRPGRRRASDNESSSSSSLRALLQRGRWHTGGIATAKRPQGARKRLSRANSILSPRLVGRCVQEGADESLRRGDWLWDRDFGECRRGALMLRREAISGWTAHETAHEKRRGRSSARLPTPPVRLL